jgi:predicted nucleotide-binding protein
VGKLKEKNVRSLEFNSWYYASVAVLEQDFGPQHDFAVGFKNIRFEEDPDPDNWMKDLEVCRSEAVHKGLLKAEAILQEALDVAVALNPAVTSTAVPSHHPKARFVFISHGPAGAALSKTQDFLRDLGFEPVVAEREPSGGSAVDDHVQSQMDKCGSAIILATCDDRMGDHYQPKGNVTHEVGLAEKMYDGRIIYLLERGCQFPSNIAVKVWGNFTRDNMEEAFGRIARELRGFGFLRAG